MTCPGARWGATAAVNRPEQARISVVIPTYNRCGLLGRTLESLAGQRLPAGEFEVIVADDGSADETAEVARSFSGRLRLRYCFQEDQGYRVAAARNAGARLAAAPVLAFLDSGTLPGPDFVRGHLAAHAAADGEHVVLGYCFGYRPLDDIPWLTAALTELKPAQVVERYGSDPAFQDVRHTAFANVGFDLARLAVPWIFCWSMNCSLSAGTFWRVGGFDESFRTWGSEDMELGYRLFHGGVRSLVSRDAWTIELPHERRLKANRQNNKRNLLRVLQKHCEPFTEIVCAAELRDAVPPIEADSVALRSWTRAAADLDVRAELEKAAAQIPAEASVAIFGCGEAIPESLAPCILTDFDGRLLARALADGRHTGYRLIGLRTPLRAGSVDVVIITSRLTGLWDRWGEMVLAEAHRIGRQVHGPPGAA
jgi:glycosyltransferase involved in cell wall biosynthesis